MNKFFLFRREEINESSSRASDSGIGVSVFAVSTSHLSFITAYKGFVNITFNDSGLYEQVSLFVGDSIEKTNVTVSCVPGEELLLIENMLNFVSKESKENIMSFDVVAKSSNFSTAIVEEASDLQVKLKVNPTTMNVSKVSLGDSVEEAANTIAGINFNGHLPELDYNHEGLSSFADGAEITSWANDGGGGASYNIATNVGVPLAETSSATSGVSTASAYIPVTAHFIIPSSFTVKNDYTIYFVLGITSDTYGPLYGDSIAETLGFCGKFFDSGGVGTKFSPSSSVFASRHSSMTGFVSSATTKDSNDGTSSFSFPFLNEDSDGYESCQSFVIRRDKEGNMFLHNYKGEVIGFLKAKTRFTDSSLSSNSSERTDGDLLLERLGTAGDDVSSCFKGHLSRFGVIDHDIGVSSAYNLSTDLFNFYNI